MNRITPGGSNGRRAFTLIELLLSATLIAIISFALFASLRGAFAARKSCETAIAATRDSEAVMETLRTDLMAALPPTGTYANTFVGADAQDDRGADADDLYFCSTAVAPAHPEGGNGDIKQFEITLYQPAGSNDHVLVRRAYNILPPPTTSAQPYDEEVLCRHVAGFNLRYFDGTDWQDSWNAPTDIQTLPLAVEVTLTIQSPQNHDDGSPKTTQFVRVFPIPCSGQTATGGINVSASGSSKTGGTQ